MEIIRVKHHEVEEETEGEKKNRGGKTRGGEMDVEPAEKQRITKNRGSDALLLAN